MIPTGEATIGPFFPPRYVDAAANDLTQFEGRMAQGEAIEIFGCVRSSGGAMTVCIVDSLAPVS